MVNSTTECKFLIVREFDKERDVKVVEKLERNCEIGTKKGVSIFTNMMGDPLSRIRFYPIHVILVAELLESKEIVGVVRGCIKNVGTTTPPGSLLKMGCIIGLRVSPTYRRKGVALKLVTSLEEWMVRNGAEYSYLATEKNNEASKALFALKCNYVSLSSLVIFVHPTSTSTCLPTKHISERDIKIEKVNIDQAISLYKRILKTKELYPLDIDTILKEKLSLGTWVCYYKDEGCIKLQNMVDNNEDFITTNNNQTLIGSTSSSWVIFSIWNTCESYKLQIKKSSHHHPLRFLHTTLKHAREKIIFPCLRILVSESLSRPFGFLFLYGLHGEGNNLGNLMEFIWRFTSRLGESMKDCRVVITELGLGDPLANYVPQTNSMSCIDDLWYTKRLSSIGHNNGKDEEMAMKRYVGNNVFVDPREF
ncbi:probable N-acetyltransferase HLS1 [Arachis duranensis]|uniref:Probable N-acetyltransferase HLS1 n=1 Tax=Arachis duranensis TaxID=130453 RepID=A0A6P4CYS4_ARADU|nr:probable N-acetyltransferase HLS1 [Arachis duranensis]